MQRMTVARPCRQLIRSPAVLWLQAVVHVMSNFKEIETCLECSAKNLVFVAEVSRNRMLTLRQLHPCQRFQVDVFQRH